MDPPPLTLSLLHIGPSTLRLPGDQDPPPARPLPKTPIQPSIPLPTLSPTHSYPAPHPSASLGSTLQLKLKLANTRSSEPVMGVRMMCEVQGPNGRYRLGEVVHGETLGQQGDADSASATAGTEVNTSGGPGGTGGTLTELDKGQSVELDVSSELRETGMHIVIVSVAWETLDGRRTLQRFFKFTVDPPLSIRTRVHNSHHANTLLDPIARERIYLEVVAHNVSAQGIVFDRVRLESVHGLVARHAPSPLPSPGSRQAAEQDDEPALDTTTLMPGESRQYLFVLSPAPRKDTAIRQSTFPPGHLPGTVLPLGRLDLQWRSGDAHDLGRLQTSTLNRRVPQQPPLVISGPGLGQPATPTPTRTLTAHPPSPSPARVPSPRPPPKDAAEPRAASLWELDLVVLERSKSVRLQDTFTIKLRVGVRSSRPLEQGVEEKPPAPAPPRLAVQHLTRIRPLPESRPPAQPGIPSIAIDPSRSGTPMTRTGSGSSVPSRDGDVGGPLTTPRRPFSPLSVHGQTPSRPMTPVSAQLRQATSSHIGPSLSLFAANVATPARQQPTPTVPIAANIQPTLPGPSFPPPPIIETTTTTIPPPQTGERDQYKGTVEHLGVSFEPLSLAPLEIVEERSETTYVDPIAPLRRWESITTHSLDFIALAPGSSELGGFRILMLDDEQATLGTVGQEWESLGEIWVA